MEKSCHMRTPQLKKKTKQKKAAKAASTLLNPSPKEGLG